MNDSHDQHPSASLLLHEAVDDLPVDVDRLVRGGLDRGRTIRRRRRVGASLAAAVVVGAVGVAVSVGPGEVGDGGRGLEVADPAGTTGADAAPLAAERRDLYVSPEEVPSVFAELFPGEVADNPAAYAIYRLGAHFLWEGYALRIDFTQADAVGTNPAQWCARSAASAEDCRTLASGTVLRVEPAADANPRNSAWAYTPDGWMVTVSADTVQVTGAEPGAPSLTLDQVVEAATSDEWFSSETRRIGTATPGAPTDVEIAVAAADVPTAIADLLGGEAGAISTATGSELVDEPRRKIVQFSYDGTATTFVIEPQEALASCAALVDPADQPDGQPGGECVERDGVEVLLQGPEQQGAALVQSVMAWREGYVVSMVSTNDTGKLNIELPGDPAISMAELERVVLSDAWF